MNKIECPYCNHMQEADTENLDIFDEGQNEGYCRECGKQFVYTVSYQVYFDSEKADCLNGSPHKWRPIHGGPREFFVGKYHCRDCPAEEKRDCTLEEWEKILKADRER